MFRSMSFEEARRESRKITEPRALRAVAHPTRLELMELLGREGELTATRAGELLDLSPANCSFHLRQLAKYGFVEETGGGEGRNRPWRLASRTHQWSDSDSDAETSAAATALSMMVMEREMERLAGWFERQRDETAGWRDASSSMTAILYMTKPELAQLSRDLEGLAAPYLDRMGDPGLRPAGSRPVTLIGAAYPLVPTPSGG